MSTFEFPKSIASRPVWGTLEVRSGEHHLMIAEAEGAEAVLELATPDLMAKTHLIYIPKHGVLGKAARTEPRANLRRPVL